MSEKKDEADAVKAIAKDAAESLIDTASDAAYGVKETAAKVAHTVKELAALTSLLTEQQGDQIKKIQRNAIFSGTLVFLCIVLVLALGYAVHRIDKNEQEIRLLQESTSARVLCPLWSSFLGSYNPKSANAMENPEGYEEFFLRIEEGAEVIGCIHTKRGKMPKP